MPGAFVPPISHLSREKQLDGRASCSRVIKDSERQPFASFVHPRSIENCRREADANRSADAKCYSLISNWILDRGQRGASRMKKELTPAAHGGVSVYLRIPIIPYHRVWSRLNFYIVVNFVNTSYTFSLGQRCVSMK